MTKIADDVDFDLQAFIGQRAFFQAAPGGGKSTGARLLLEAAYGTFQELILDVDGDFHTIRGDGRDYAIIGGDNADAPLGDIAGAGVLALTILRLGVSAVLQIDDLTRDDQRRFVGNFARGLMEAPRDLWHPVILMLDEAHYFCPEGSVVASSEAVAHYATGGRKRGFSAIFATTRMSLFSKDVLGTCSNKFLGRVEQSADRAAAADQLGFTAKSADAVAMQAFEAGEFYCVGPAMSQYPVRNRLYMPQTRVPQAGVPVLPTPTPAAITKALSALVAAGKKEPENITKNITAPDQAALDAAYDRGVQAGYADGHTDGYADGIRDTEERLGRKVLDFSQQFTLSLSKLTPKPKPVPEGGTEHHEVEQAPKDVPANIAAAPAERHNANAGAGSVRLTNPQLKVLASLAWWAAAGNSTPTIAQVAVVAGWSTKSSNIRDRVTELARLELIDRPVPGSLSLSAEGRKQAPQPPQKPFRDALYGVLTNPQIMVVEALEKISGPIGVRDLAVEVGWSPDSSNIRDRLTELSTLQMIVRPVKGAVELAGWVRSALKLRGAK